MKIFISWSGKPSENIALALKDWLPLLFTGIEPFVSSENVRKGKRWQIEIAKELESSDFGIICLTPDNTEAPWILFESGALSKSLKESSVSTLLTGGLRNGDIEGPLSHFQHTSFEKEDFFKLTTAINDSQPSGKQDATRLRKIFDKFWDELSVSVEKALKTTEKPEKKRGVEDMVRELLDVTNSIAKNMPQEDNILTRLKRFYAASLLPEPVASVKWPVEVPENTAISYGEYLKILDSLNPVLARELSSITAAFNKHGQVMVFLLDSKDTQIENIIRSNGEVITAALKSLVKSSFWSIQIGRKANSPLIKP
jgi:hypothetical protein